MKTGIPIKHINRRTSALIVDLICYSFSIINMKEQTALNRHQVFDLSPRVIVCKVHADV